METDNQTPYLLTMEHERDRLSDRLVKLAHETAPNVVEGFLYVDPAKAKRVRGRLLCSLLRRIDSVNREICAVIAPEFRATPSAGFSDRVMRGLAR
jgi:hypothetical protein